MITLLQESVRFSKTPSPCVELVWTTGERILALPVGFIASADWKKNDQREKIDIDWGNWVVTLVGHGLHRLPGGLIRGEVCGITELDTETAEVTRGTVVLAMLAIKKEPEKAE